MIKQRCVCWIAAVVVALNGGVLLNAETGSSGNLRVLFADVEGGQATLLVTRAGESLLIDTGWPGNEGRDARRIAALAKQAGVQKIDYLLITHFHMDHVGGVPQLADLLPIGTFVDHGSSVENDPDGQRLFQAYAERRAKGKHLEVKPGDTIPLKGLSVRVLTAGGQMVRADVSEKANRFCGQEKPRDVDPTENARSVGVLVQFGGFRLLDLGDLTWNKELELMCPVNRVGKVDVYVVSHHGMNLSGSAALVHALGARVAIMDNGARKGGTAEAYQVVRASPGMQDIWQLHRAVAGGEENNAPEKLTANPAEAPDEGFGIELDAQRSGAFTVRNLRNQFSKEYSALVAHGAQR